MKSYKRMSVWSFPLGINSHLKFPFSDTVTFPNFLRTRERCLYHKCAVHIGRGRLKCDGTRSETRFRLSAKRTSPFKSAGGASVQSTTGNRGVRISGSNAGYTMFRGSVKSTGYPLHSPVHLNRPGGVSSVDCWQPRCAHQR